jgi:hypothetical protein
LTIKPTRSTLDPDEVILRLMGRLCESCPDQVSGAICGVCKDMRDAARLLGEQASDIRFYKDREKHISDALSVADGGKYRADFDGAIKRCIRDRAAAIERAQKAEAALAAIREEWMRIP